MKKICYSILFLGLLYTGKNASAGWDFSASLGGNYSFAVTEPSQTRRIQPWGSQIELVPSYQFSLISLDLGVVYDFLQQEFLVRPGVKFNLGWLYFRLGVPFSILMNALAGDAYDLGILVGVGVKFPIEKFYVQLEANATPFLLSLERRGLLMPVEVRLGVGYRF